MHFDHAHGVRGQLTAAQHRARRGRMEANEVGDAGCAKQPPLAIRECLQGRRKCAAVTSECSRTQLGDGRVVETSFGMLRGSVLLLQHAKFVASMLVTLLHGLSVPMSGSAREFAILPVQGSRIGGVVSPNATLSITRA
jgi:hypothetical protein